MRKFLAYLITTLFLITVVDDVFAEQTRLCEFPLRSGIFFGDSLAIVKEKEALGDEKIVEEDRPIFDNGDMIEYHTSSAIDIAGNKAEVIYYFDQHDRLIQLMYSFIYGLSTSEYNMFYESLVNKYGSPCDEKSNYPFRGNSTNLEGYSTLDFPTRIKVLKSTGWLVKSDPGYTKIDFCYYNTHLIIDGVTYDRDQARLGYLFVTEEEYLDFQQELNAKEIQIQMDQEKKNYDLEHSI